MSDTDDCISRVQAVLSLMKPEWKWAAWDHQGWYAYERSEPIQLGSIGVWRGYPIGLHEFNLPPFPGDWKDSLVRRV